MSLSASETRTWTMLCHLSALLMLFYTWGAVLGPLIIWLIKRGESPEVDEQGKESLNFQITIYIISLALSIVLGLAFFGSWGLSGLFGSPFDLFSAPHVLTGVFGLAGILGLVRLVDIILVIVASIRTNNGVPYRYPFNFRLIR
ncbi:DUF4870 domain-containing protein [Dinghuibacter silviterrae]|uniref:Tic20 family protein n=1 Tax=Dinghuibacter silviterrae TaxID=1539049 RepID=A0A4R8DHS4_9BACT|nr:DUF4870 domain-containing protein [Dinghuibacter silviterrae]TDW96500.1 hypothetical protein EDB95_4331 [Dinghuibacter silviterrae]